MFDAETLAVIATRAKRQIRGRMRALRLALPPVAVEERSREIVRRLLELPVYRNAEALALYASMEGRGEVDLVSAHEAARSDGKRIYYPFVDDDAAGHPRIGFRQVADIASLEERGRGFAEPPPDAPEAGERGLDLIVVPALAVDAEGRRLGQGSGFYDRALPRFRPHAVCVATVFDFQLLGELPVLPHDAACDTIVTDARVMDVTSASIPSK
jgi:5-formyltetrahydrofolate cyclo-ligase